jgi:hypothetical protein
MTTFLDRPRDGSYLRQRARSALLLGAFSLLVACAGNEEIYDEVRDLQESYEKATNSIYAGNYRRGIEILEILQARYPFSDVARQIQLDLMYAYYNSGQISRTNPGYSRNGSARTRTSVRRKMRCRATRRFAGSSNATLQACMRPMPSSA